MKKPVTCKKCGYVGGNARGCGTAHHAGRGGTAPDPDAPAVVPVDLDRKKRFEDIEARAKARQGG